MASNAFFVLVVAALAIFYRSSYNLHSGRVIYNHRPGACRFVEGGPTQGVVDIDLVPSKDIAFVSPRSYFDSGRICLFNFHPDTGADRYRAHELPIVGEAFDAASFHPLGLTHWLINGVIRLYAISRSSEGSYSIEVFDYDPDRGLLHNATLRHDSFVRPRDLAAIGVDELVITDEGVTTQCSILTAMELALGWRGGSVYRWDGEAFYRLLSNKGSPRGVAFDRQSGKLFVSMYSDRILDVFDLSEDHHSLISVSSISLGEGADALSVAESGIVYASCHRSRNLAEQLRCTGGGAPSEIVRVQFNATFDAAEISEPYANDGAESISASSGVVFQNQVPLLPFYQLRMQMLIGSQCGSLIHCDVVDQAVL